MARGSRWWGRQIAAMPEFGTPRMAGVIGAVLFTLCGLLISDFGVLIPEGPGVNRRLVVLIGLAAVLVGGLAALVPWQRWRRSATLWLVPVAFALIAAHNYASGADGYRYNVFFFVVFVWIGLMHPGGTSLRMTPLMVAAYLAPAVWLHDMSTVAAALSYTLPVCLLAGECASLVSARLRHSEQVVRASELRLQGLVHNATDVITLVDTQGVIRWESPSVTAVLGYDPHERIGQEAFAFVHPEQAEPLIGAVMGVAATPGSTQQAEVRCLHKDGSWRWCEVKVHNLADDPAVAGIVVNVTDITERHRVDDVRRRLAAIVESSADAITAQTTGGRVLSWNSAAERMYGCTAAEMVGRNIRALVPADRIAELDDLMARVRADEAVAPVETQRLRRDGSTIDVSLSLSAVHDASGAVVAVSSIARDITDIVRSRRAIAEREADFRQLFAVNPQPMWVYDFTTMSFLEVNDAAVRHYGYAREAFLAMPVTELGPLTQGAARHVLADGRVIDVEVTSHRLEFDGHDAVLVAVQDVTERNALDAQLRHQAFHDSLTGLSNRALFADRVQHALTRRSFGEHPILLLLDLDRFKLINDSLGHAVGDELLIEVARRLEASVRLGDTVARLGGDEFAILLEEGTLAAAERQANRLLQALTRPMTLRGHGDHGGQQVVATASIGIAVADESMSAGELLRNADVAMYRAKAAGGGRFQMFQAAMFAAAARQMELTAAMREALGTEQFELHFQPVVDIKTGHVTSMEALARWHHPELGLLMPKEFIPVAEESGLILPLGAWVLTEACAAAAAWTGGTGVNVNISGCQLADPAIVDQVSAALLASGLDASRLTLEITESVVMQHSEANMRRLRRLRELGVGLSIDDFGTGYSSLSYLRAFPVHELKIDRSFVAGMSGDPDSLALVRTIVQLADSLSLRTVAEGVETAAQYDALRALGCDRVQGFYVSAPTPVRDAVAIAGGDRPWHIASGLPPQRSIDLVERG